MKTNRGDTLGKREMGTLGPSEKGGGPEVVGGNCCVLFLERKFGKSVPRSYLCRKESKK